ncbi:MAG: hypothetical protein R3272_06520 [Candidatus Promineifilaceae bacterium]|nr:hypothetical protein [Candidatus Promineifilaceae bacterium]
MIDLYDVASGEKIGEITESQLQFLIAWLEEESLEDQDYYINRATLDWLEKRGADDELLALLQRALGSREAMEIRWEE